MELAVGARTPHLLVARPRYGELLFRIRTRALSLAHELGQHRVAVVDIVLEARRLNAKLFEHPQENGLHGHFHVQVGRLAEQVASDRPVKPLAALGGVKVAGEALAARLVLLCDDDVVTAIPAPGLRIEVVERRLQGLP